MKIGDLLYFVKNGHVYGIKTIDRLVHIIPYPRTSWSSCSFGINDLKLSIERKEILLLNTELSRLLFVGASK